MIAGSHVQMVKISTAPGQANRFDKAFGLFRWNPAKLHAFHAKINPNLHQAGTSFKIPLQTLKKSFK